MAHADDQGGSMGIAALDLVAAVDLGSNSFHMLVARMDGGRLVVVDRMKDPCIVVVKAAIDAFAPSC